MPEQPPDPGERSPDRKPGESGRPPEGTTGQSPDGRPAGQPPDRRQPERLSGDGSHSRRQLLKAGGVVGLIGALGFGFLYWERDGSVTASSIPEGTPEGVDFVAYGEASTLLSDAEFRSAIDEELAAQGMGSTLSDLLDGIERTTGIDPRSAGTTTGFGAATEYGAVIFEAEAEPDGIRASLAAAGVLLDEAEYEGRELYLVGNDAFVWDLYLCALDDGEFAVGTRPEIEDIIDVREGTAPGVDGPITTAVGSAPVGTLQFGFLVPDNLLERLGIPAVGSQLVDLGDLEYGYGSVDRGELTVTVRTVSSGAAEDFGSQLRAIGSLLGASDGDIIDLPDAIREQLLDVLSGIEVETDGRRVQTTVPGGYRLAAIAIVFLLGGQV